MSDWRDTFERFHDICNQEETRRMNDAEKRRGDDYFARMGRRARSTGPADRIGAKLDADLRSFAIEELAKAGVSEKDMSGAVDGALALAASGSITVKMSTEEVREDWATAFATLDNSEAYQRRIRQFDEWLTAVEADAWDDGAANYYWDNPYRDTGDADA